LPVANAPTAHRSTMTGITDARGAPRLALGCALWGKDKSQAFG